MAVRSFTPLKYEEQDGGDGIRCPTLTFDDSGLFVGYVGSRALMVVTFDKGDSLKEMYFAKKQTVEVNTNCSIKKW